MNYNTENNRANIIGTLESDFTFDHEIYGEQFFSIFLLVPRLSGAIDKVRVMVSERLLIGGYFEKGDKIEVIGQFRSYNSYEDGNNRLVLTVFAKELRRAGDENGRNPNELFLDGYICKSPVYRTTPFGREIAVNRSYNKSDYIPVIAWGRNARYALNFKVGDHVRIWGRIQSREYQKKISENEIVMKTAFEVSINRIELIEKEEKQTDSTEGNISFENESADLS